MAEINAADIAKKAVGWSIFVSVIMIVAGLLAIAMPLEAGIAVNLFVAWMLVFAAVAHFIFAWYTRRTGSVLRLTPALTIAFLFRSIFAFKVFDEIFLLTSGGPGTSTEVVSLHLFKVFFEQNDLGYGALLSIVIILAIAAFLATARGFAWRVG